MTIELEYNKGKENFSKNKEWVYTLSKNVHENCGESIKNLVMKGVPIDPDEDNNKFIDFTINALNTIDTIIPEDVRKKILNGCSCIHPIAKLKPIKDQFALDHDSSKAHAMLQKLFESELKEMEIDQKFKDEINKRDFGIAGRKVRDIIVVKKIPNEIENYFNSKDIKQKRASYCHCPIIKKIIQNDKQISETYCNCGAGYYKGIWEYITDKEVRVDVLETVLKGNDSCKFSIILN